MPAKVEAMQARGLATTTASSQASRSAADCVGFIHQIYGLFGDGKPMSDLFERSQRCWCAVALGMSAQYYAWGPGQLESLIKQRYPDLWDVYRDVRYPVMRCDIGRLAILHSYGGLYADMDTLPVRARFPQTDLSVSRVDLAAHRRRSAAARSQRRWGAERRAAKENILRSLHGKQPKRKQPCFSRKHKFFLEMEVIISSKHNPVLLRWLEHMKLEIASRDYSAESSWWRKAKMRYIYHTTGPLCMRRFLHLPANAEVLRDMEYVEMNHFRDANILTSSQRLSFDVISHESNSYFTSEQRVEVAVGHGDEQLPELAVTRCLRTENDHATAPLIKPPQPRLRCTQRTQTTLWTT